MRRIEATLLCLVTALAGVPGAACRRGGAPTSSAPSTQSVPAVAIVLTTPANAARSVLTCLRAERAARLQQDEQAVRYCQDELRLMAARDVILRRYEDLLRSPPADPDKELDNFVSGWGPTIGFYAEGLQLDRIEEPILTADRDRASVRVPAVSPAGSAVIRVECFRGVDKQWRVARLDFEPAPVASRPATVPVP